MSIETYIQMEGDKITELELSTNELVDVALGINYAQGFDLNVDLQLVSGGALYILFENHVR